MSTTATTAERHLAVVEGIYDAFGSGDVPAILERLDPDVAWDVFDAPTGAQEAGVPYLLERRGPAEVGAFFATLGALEFGEFSVLDLTAGGDKVFAEIRTRITSRATGRTLHDNELHQWTFGADGRVVAFRHYVDTAKHAAINA